MSEPSNDHSNDQTDEPTERPAAGPSPRAGWRHRAYGVKGVAAVALASLIIGGGVGAAIHAVADDDGGRDGRPGFGRDGGRGDGRGPWDQRPVPPGGVPAPPTVPSTPATPPAEGAAPESPGATTSGSTT